MVVREMIKSVDRLRRESQTVVAVEGDDITGQVFEERELRAILA